MNLALSALSLALLTPRSDIARRFYHSDFFWPTSLSSVYLFPPSYFGRFTFVCLSESRFISCPAFFLSSYSMPSLNHLPALPLQSAPRAERKEKFRKSKKMGLVWFASGSVWVGQGWHTHTHPEISGGPPQSQPSQRHNPRGEGRSELVFV